MERSVFVNPWVIEERLALVPVIGKLVMKDLPTPDLLEERIRFGTDPHQRVLLYWPEQAARCRRSAVLFLHGGGWSSGAPQLYRFVGRFFAGLGFPTLVGGYRLAPDFLFPTQLDDIAAGLVAGLEVFASRGLSVDRIIAGGHSAGAHLAALLVYNLSRNGRGLLNQSRFAGYYAISGPLSFADCTNASLRKMIADFLGKRSDWQVADPIRQIHGDEQVPALIIHGDRDPLVDVDNALAFARRLARSRSCPVNVHLVRGGHHADQVALFVDDLPAGQVLKEWAITCDEG